MATLEILIPNTSNEKGITTGPDPIKNFHVSIMGLQQSSLEQIIELPKTSRKHTIVGSQQIFITQRCQQL